jgi:thiamine pyrophosphate-dependent acetolactate synthase large subunit-like protein
MIELARVDALRAIDAAFPNEPTVLTLGTTVREMLLVTDEKPNHLPVLDSMGLPAAIGLGLAQGLAASRFQKLVVIEGDGSLLMGFTTLTTIGRLKPSKLLLIVLDNGTYAATGGQASGSDATDLVGVARACGFEGQEVDTIDALTQALDRARATPGPLLLRVRIGAQQQTAGYYLPDPAVLTDRFTRYLRENG